MRILALAILAIGTISIGSAAAQTYDPAYPVCLHVVRPDQLLRMPLHVAASVQRVGIGPRRPVRHQSISCERASARGLLAASPRLLRLILEQTSSMKFDSSGPERQLVTPEKTPGTGVLPALDDPNPSPTR